MKNIRFFSLIALLVIIGIVATLIYTMNPGKRKEIGERPQQIENEAKGLTGPILRSQHQVSAAPTVTPKPKANQEVIVSQPVQPGATKPVPIRIFTGKPAAPEPEPLSDYAPYGRLIKCELVNTVDSSSMTTPIIGLVSEDVAWDGKIIIPRRSEVHGIAQLDQTRERIASEGTFTFVLNDPEDSGVGRELVLSGIVLDREEDADLKTFGITDGSAGLRGVVIKTDKLAEVKVFIATFLSGIGEALQSTSTDLFGNVRSNPNGKTAGVPGYIVNPVAQGSQNVLDLYAQQILQAIQRDGTFVRVQAGKQFYVYIRQVIDLNRATIGGDAVRDRMKKEYLEQRSEEEKITEPRRKRDHDDTMTLLQNFNQANPVRNEGAPGQPTPESQPEASPSPAEKARP
jgi:hypothetical protein